VLGKATEVVATVTIRVIASLILIALITWKGKAAMKTPFFFNVPKPWI
jgi:hypothetical protein